MYDLFNVLAWIWIVVLAFMLIVGIWATLYRIFVSGYPRSLKLRIATFGQLYGRTWLIPALATAVALTVDFDPDLQWWVVVTSVAFIILRFINVFATKVVNP
ncbi:hypothetical protein [Xanthomonas phage RTH11]|nr:hypothetical protein [Xanthomonas phage RTH11]